MAFSSNLHLQLTLRILLPVTMGVFMSGCSVGGFIMNRIAGSVQGLDELYLMEDDPELVRESMPSNLKILELLIMQSPKDSRLLESAAQAFTTYGYAFVLRDAELMMYRDVHEARRLRERSKRLFARAKRYAFSALEVRYPGFAETYPRDPDRALQRVGVTDVGLLYWTAAAWGSLISSAKDDPAAVVELPNIGYLLERALQLDETYDSGALHEMMISYSLARPDAGGTAMDEALHHYGRALELSGGKRASVFVSYAEAVSVKNQDKEEFLLLLNKAMAIDVDETPSVRLPNILAQERAGWLKEHVDDLFF